MNGSLDVLRKELQDLVKQSYLRAGKSQANTQLQESDRDDEKLNEDSDSNLTESTPEREIRDRGNRFGMQGSFLLAASQVDQVATRMDEKRAR